jgi:hypothetical protein
MIIVTVLAYSCQVGLEVILSLRDNILCQEAEWWHQLQKWDILLVNWYFIFFADKSSKFAPCEALIHHIRFDVMLFHPITRKLINESSGTFLAGQKLVANAGGTDIRGELLKLSLQYR